MIGLNSETLLKMMITGLPIEPGSAELMYFQRVAEAIEENNIAIEFALKDENKGFDL